MKIKTSEATPIQLNFLVAKCENPVMARLVEDAIASGITVHTGKDCIEPLQYSTDWSQGGPIIEREEIETRKANKKEWGAWTEKTGCLHGPTALIAAMRCYVILKMGDEIEIPEELS